MIEEKESQPLDQYTPAVLTAISVDPHDIALLIFKTWSVLYLLLYAATEKSLQIFT